MDGIIIPNTKEIFESLAESPSLRYAARYPVESGLAFHGTWQCDHYRNGRLISGGIPEAPNTFTTEGMAYLLNILFHDIQKAAAEIWYVGIYKNNVTPALGNTAAACLGAAGTYGECQDADYDNPATNKPAYTTDDTAIASITNAVGGKAQFVMAATITLYGAFLSSAAAKTATTGKLMCAKKFASAKNVEDNDEIYITYTIDTTTS